MSNATAIKDPFIVRCIGGQADGQELPCLQEPSAHQRLEFVLFPELVCTPQGETKATRERHTHHYIYLGSGKAAPLNTES